MEAKEVLDKVIKHSGLNAKTLSEKLGLERPQAIYDILKGKTITLSPSMSDKILSVFPEINRSWLLTGEGNMLKQFPINAAIEQMRSFENKIKYAIDKGGSMRIPDLAKEISGIVSNYTPNPSSEIDGSQSIAAEFIENYSNIKERNAELEKIVNYLQGQNDLLREQLGINKSKEKSEGKSA